MDDIEWAKFVFLTWVYLQQQINEAVVPELRLQLIAQRQAVWGMLKSAGFNIKVAAPCIPEREIKVTFSLTKAGEEKVMISEELTIRLSAEQVQKIREAQFEAEERDGVREGELIYEEESQRLLREIMGGEDPD